MERGKGKMEDGRRQWSILRFPLSVSRWAPVLLWAAGIFYFSSRPDPLSFLPSSEHDTLDIGNLAHIGEYAGLVGLLYRALRERGSGGAGGQGKVTEGRSAHNPKLAHASQPLCTSAQKAAVVGRSALLSVAIALAYAIVDELHQGLVPGRGFKLADIGYDLVGMTAALGLIWMRERGGGKKRMDGGEG